jgi:hypothetical protein
MEAGAEALSSYVWLQSGPLDYSPARGALHLANGRLTFVISEPPGEKKASWLEEASGQPGIAERLENGEQVQIFDVPVSDTEVRFPVMSLGALMFLTVGGTRYRLNFYDPARGARPTGRLGVFKGMAAGRPWKRALKGSGR